MDEPKKLAFLSMKGGAPPDDPDDAPPSHEEGLHVAAEAAMAAIKSGDSKGFLDAVQNIFEMMEARPHPEAAPEEAA